MPHSPGTCPLFCAVLMFLVRSTGVLGDVQMGIRCILILGPHAPRIGEVRNTRGWSRYYELRRVCFFTPLVPS